MQGQRFRNDRFVSDIRQSGRHTRRPRRRLGLRVRPGGRKSRLTGVYGNRLKVEVSAPPERGKANEAVLRLVAEALGVRRGAQRVQPDPLR